MVKEFIMMETESITNRMVLYFSLIRVMFFLLILIYLSGSGLKCVLLICKLLLPIVQKLPMGKVSIRNSCERLSLLFTIALYISYSYSFSPPLSLPLSLHLSLFLSLTLSLSHSHFLFTSLSSPLSLYLSLSLSLSSPLSIYISLSHSLFTLHSLSLSLHSLSLSLPLSLYPSLSISLSSPLTLYLSLSLSFSLSFSPGSAQVKLMCGGPDGSLIDCSKRGTFIISNHQIILACCEINTDADAHSED